MSVNAASPFFSNSSTEEAPLQEWPRTDWRSAASCSEATKTNLFFPVGVTGSAEVQIRQAKTVCEECPVKAECLEFAITSNQEYGVWGGTSEEERRVLRRTWRAEQRALRNQAARKAS